MRAERSPSAQEAAAHISSYLQEAPAPTRPTRDLSPDLAQYMSELGIPKWCLPTRLGGLGRPLSSLVDLAGAIAKEDASIAWCVFVMATSPWLLCRASDDLIDEIYGPSAEVRIAGVIAASGTLTGADHRLVLDGQWRFATAAAVSDWVLLGARPALENAAVAPHMLVAVRTTDLLLLDDWHGLGLRTSGSGSVLSKGIDVHPHHIFALHTPNRWPEAMFDAPFKSTFAVAGAIAVGVAAHAVDAVVALAATRRPTFGRASMSSQPHVQRLVAEAQARILAARAFLDSAVAAAESIEATTAADGRVAVQLTLRLAVAEAGRTARAVTEQMHRAGGGASTADDSELSVALRDAYTLTQHYMFSEEIDEALGAAILGLPVDLVRI
jgi:alkylation response protein AidB-like acyl-CoA dehydrogenase